MTDNDLPAETWFDAEVTRAERLDPIGPDDNGNRWRLTLEGNRWFIPPQLGAKVSIVLTTEAPRFYARGGEIFDNQTGDRASLVGTFGEHDLAARVVALMNGDAR